MSNEFKHADPGDVLTQAEYIGDDAHVAEGQTDGDILYFNGSTGKWERTNLLKITEGGIVQTVGTRYHGLESFHVATGDANDLELAADISSGTAGKGVRIKYFNAASFTWITAMAIDNVASGDSIATWTGVQHKLNLPTSNPGAGILWSDSGTVKVGT